MSYLWSILCHYGALHNDVTIEMSNGIKIDRNKYIQENREVIPIIYGILLYCDKSTPIKLAHI